MRSADLVVVGNGAVGLAAATAAARALPDSRVLLVGPAHRAGGASPAAGAMLGCFGEVVRTTLASPEGEARFALQLEAQRRWGDELDELQHDYAEGPLRTGDGTFVVLNARGGTLDTANFDAMVHALDTYGGSYSVVAEVPGLNPSPDARPLRSIFLPDEAGIDVTVLLSALQRRAEAAGVESIDDQVVELRRDENRIVGVELRGGGAVSAPTVALATGAQLSHLLRPLGEGLVQPVLAGAGLALVTERVMGTGFDHVVRSVTRAGSCGLHVVPLGNRREYVGATNVVFATPELRPHLGILEFLTNCAIDQLDRKMSYSRVEEFRLGNRPVPLDGFPLLGPGPLEGLWILGGGYRDGLHGAPEVAARFAQSLREGRSCFPEAFDPLRRPIATMSIEASIEDFVLQQVSSAVEGGVELSPFMDYEDLGTIWRPMAVALYEELEVEVGLPTDVVTFCCLSRKRPEDLDAIRAYLRGRA